MASKKLDAKGFEIIIRRLIIDLRALVVLVPLLTLAACKSDAEMTQAAFRGACYEALIDKDLTELEVKNITLSKPVPFDFDERLDFLLRQNSSWKEQFYLAKKEIKKTQLLLKNNMKIEKPTLDDKLFANLLNEDLKRFVDLKETALRLSRVSASEIEEAATREGGEESVILKATILYLGFEEHEEDYSPQTDEEFEEEMENGEPLDLSTIRLGDEYHKATCTKYAYRGFYRIGDGSLKRVALVLED